jgi:hypothetical protein
VWCIYAVGVISKIRGRSIIISRVYIMFDPMELAGWIFAIAMVVFIVVQIVVYVRANPIQTGGKKSKRGMSKEFVGAIVVVVIAAVYLYGKN